MAQRHITSSYPLDPTANTIYPLDHVLLALPSIR
jgi:hypothetical protein